MFTAARYVVVDDEAKELNPLVNALHKLGAPCIGILWEPTNLPKPELLKGVRILFQDLHLTKGELAPKAHYDTIATMLDGAIQQGHGPYVVVLWTSHEEQRKAFAERLAAALPAEKLPVAVLGLDKNKYREGEEFTKLVDLQNDVVASLAGNEQLHALLSWEQDVVSAADAVLAQVGALVPAKLRTINDLPKGLNDVLSLLASAALGANASIDPRSGVSRALAPLLADRIANQPADAGKDELWKAAVTFPKDANKLTDQQCAEMNAMIHLAMPETENITRIDWGAVLPLKDVSAQTFEQIFGSDAETVAGDAFQLKPGQENCSLVLVRIGAVCDYAQGKKGPIPYVLGLISPPKYEKINKSSPAELGSPLLQTAKGGPPERLTVNPRYAVTLTTAIVDTLPQPIMRIREQLLVSFVAHTSSHVVRPGILSFS